MQSVYWKLLGRQADPSGLTGWVGYLGHSHPVTQLRAVILGSDEYFARHGATITGFLQGLYQDLLGRAMDPASSGWAQALAGGLTRSSAATFFLASQEAANDIVDALYVALLHRHADAGGLQGFSAALQAGMSVEGVTDALAASQEYYQLAGA